jgi:hypothetical protein
MKAVRGLEQYILQHKKSNWEEYNVPNAQHS